MTDRNQAARAAMAALRERYRAGSAAIVERLLALAEELAASPASPAVIETIRREAHKLHGTAGTHGFAKASRLAEDMQHRCVGWLRDGAGTAPLATDVEHFARELGRAFTDDADAPDDGGTT